MPRPAVPRPAALPGPSNLVHPSQTGIEGVPPDPGAVPADGVGSTLETEAGDRARVDPDPAETPGQGVPDPEVPDPEPGARRNEPSWEAAALNRAKDTRLIPLSGAGTTGCPGVI